MTSKSKGEDGLADGVDLPPLHKDFSSTPNLKTAPSSETPALETGDGDPDNGTPRHRRTFSQERVNVLNELNARGVGPPSLSSEGGVNQQRGYCTLPNRKKQGNLNNVNGGGNHNHNGSSNSSGSNVDSSSDSGYRTPIPQSAAAAGSLPPPDHPPPPIPVVSPRVAPGQGSDYAQIVNGGGSPSKETAVGGEKSAAGDSQPGSPTSSIMSSFKPSDNAKLYASPENVQSVAFRPKATSPSASSPKKRGSPPTRAHSMPPRPSRPQVLRRSMIAEIPVSSSSSNSVDPSVAISPQAMEMYAINGVSYTTYTTFRSVQ